MISATLTLSLEISSSQTPLCAPIRHSLYCLPSKIFPSTQGKSTLQVICQLLISRLLLLPSPTSPIVHFPSILTKPFYCTSEPRNWPNFPIIQWASSTEHHGYDRATQLSLLSPSQEANGTLPNSFRGFLLKKQPKPGWTLSSTILTTVLIPSISTATTSTF